MEKTFFVTEKVGIQYPHWIMGYESSFKKRFFVWLYRNKDWNYISSFRQGGNEYYIISYKNCQFSIDKRGAYKIRSGFEGFNKPWKEILKEWDIATEGVNIF